ncbi:uncharacterized protein M421DRAFT_93367 [Didymella exigua CBS 183.55]|uniref:Uncharacterized protein n=1 Tax=Didymella exigua CBS 183.55 TaxID=1150837 RepID=A0A6A5RIM4_9PLEO|nr:uncharacterized protein M421DRAFT_93367 [Didymella exigua CBS 183.55]KAF1927100.1 hypothetical protein M421DRAFT_93367 [Didymella exigua CBS 183.55]
MVMSLRSPSRPWFWFANITKPTIICRLVPRISLSHVLHRKQRPQIQQQHTQTHPPVSSQNRPTNRKDTRPSTGPTSYKASYHRNPPHYDTKRNRVHTATLASSPPWRLRGPSAGPTASRMLSSMVDSGNKDLAERFLGCRAGVARSDRPAQVPASCKMEAGGSPGRVQ